MAKGKYSKNRKNFKEEIKMADNANVMVTGEVQTQEAPKTGGFMNGLMKVLNHPVTKLVGCGVVGATAGGVAGHVSGKKAGTVSGYNAGYDAAALANARAERVDVDTEE